MTTLGERLKKALADSGASQRELAKAVGRTPAAVNFWVTGRTKTMSADDAKKAGEFLRVSPIWLATGDGQERQTVEALCPGEPVPDGFVEIPELDVRATAGDHDGGDQTLSEEVLGKIIRPLAWFQAHGLNPSMCRYMTVHGESMEPLLWEGDEIMINCAPQPILNGKIYVFLLDGMPRVKRLFKLINGTLLIKSENPDFPEERLEGEDINRFKLVGRVVERTGSSNL